MQPSANCPKNATTLANFERIKNQKLGKPPFKLNATNVKNVDLIWSSIAEAKKTWRGAHNVRIPTCPMDRKEYWGHFAKVWPGQPIGPVVEFLINSTGDGKVAIDLGCGMGPATPLLLKKGWRVLAVDSSRSALDILRASHTAAVESGQLTLIEADILHYTPPEPVDLVLATDTLPYLDPEQFQPTWMKIHASFIKPNGHLIGNLFYMTDAKKTINLMIEQGAWFLHDARMVVPLLTSTGYDIVKCEDRDDGPNEKTLCKQFIIQKRA